MKSCLNFRMWLMPLMVIALFMGNISQVDGQILVIRSSNPKADVPIGEQEDPCYGRNSNNIFVSILKSSLPEKASVSHVGLVVEGLTEEVQSVENVTNVSPQMIYLSYKITFNHNLGHYVNNSTSVDDIEFELSVGYLIGNVIQSTGRLNGGSLKSTFVKDMCAQTGYTLSSFRKGTAGLGKENISEINVYPNPAKDKLTLEFDVMETSDITISVINSLGQNIKGTSSNINLAEGMFSKDIDLSNMAKGIYYILITTNEERHIQKITKI